MPIGRHASLLEHLEAESKLALRDELVAVPAVRASGARSLDPGQPRQTAVQHAELRGSNQGRRPPEPTAADASRKRE